MSMRDILHTVVVVIVLILLLSVVAPGAYFIARVMDTWTRDNTNQLLGGILAICGGSGAVVATVIGMGVFARLAGWKPPRRDVEPTQALPPASQVDVLPPSTPPWGLTGGGTYQLLPAPDSEDRRYQIVVKKPEDK